jgi:hypothetical protein
VVNYPSWSFCYGRCAHSSFVSSSGAVVLALSIIFGVISVNNGASETVLGFESRHS